ncbi:unnamed protein product, partial [Choristocarpus tenellus]
MDDASFREQLVCFSLRGSSDSFSSSSVTGGSGTAAVDAEPVLVEPQHRPLLLPVVTRLVYGRLASWGSKGRAAGHGGPAARRAAVLAFLSGLSSDELASLFSLMFRPFLTQEVTTAAAGQLPLLGRTAVCTAGRGGGDLVVDADTTNVLRRAGYVGVEQVARVSASRQAGFLKMVKDVARQLGHRALPYVGGVLSLVLALLQHTNNLAASEVRGRRGSGGYETQAKDGEEVDIEGEGEAEAMEEEEEDMEGETGVVVPSSTDKPSWSYIASGTLRALCLRTLSELLSHFAGALDITPFSDALWKPLTTPITGLAASTIGAVRSPALLGLAVVVADREVLLPMLSTEKNGPGQALVPAVLDCLSAGSESGRLAGAAVMGSVLSFVERLLDHDGGHLLHPHLNRLIASFAARLNSATQRGGAGSGSGARGCGWDGHTERGMAILSRVAGMAAASEVIDGDVACHQAGMIDAASMSQLIAILVPFLRPDRRASDVAKASILRTIAALANRADSPGARQAWSSLSRLLGPVGPRPSTMAAPLMRRELVGALKALGARVDLSSSAGPAMTLLGDLNALDASALDEPDFQRAVPAYNSLSEGSGWADVIMAAQETAAGDEEEGKSVEGHQEVGRLGGVLAVAPLVCHCLHTLHGAEVALRGAATAALKRLVREAAARGGRGVSLSSVSSSSSRDQEILTLNRCPWEGLIRGFVMPGLRAGVACRSEVVRKGFISVLRETVANFHVMGAGGDGDKTTRDGGEASPMEGPKETMGVSSVVPVDLWVLASEEDPEVDFFLNACHIQVHRRARALARSTKASEVGLVGQAVSLVGALSRHLPWTHYSSVLKGLMVRVRGRGGVRSRDSSGGGGGEEVSPEKERALIGAMCAVLDNFHFELCEP